MRIIKLGIKKFEYEEIKIPRVYSSISINLDSIF